MQPSHPNRLHALLNAGQVSATSSAAGLLGVSGALQDDKGPLLTRVERSTTGIEAIAAWFTKDSKASLVNPADVKQIGQALSDPKGALLSAIREIPSALDRGVDRLLSNMRPPLPTTSGGADELMACLRVVNQAEDLVTDTSFTVAKNNKDLQTRLGEQPTKDALKMVGRDQQLYADFTAIYAPFTSKPADLWQERIARVGAIQRLRLNLSAFFS